MLSCIWIKACCFYCAQERGRENADVLWHSGVEQSVLQMKKQETGRWDPKKACKTKTWSINFSYQMQEKLNYDVNGFLKESTVIYAK